MFSLFGVGVCILLCIFGGYFGGKHTYAPLDKMVSDISQDYKGKYSMSDEGADKYNEFEFLENIFKNEKEEKRELVRELKRTQEGDLAVLVLYYGVAHWNSWFNASIYITENERLPIQNILRSILLENSSLQGEAANGDNYNAYAETIKYAAIVVSTVPILCVYPFLQKYFTKGAMIGAVKG